MSLARVNRASSPFPTMPFPVFGPFVPLWVLMSLLLTGCVTQPERSGQERATTAGTASTGPQAVTRYELIDKSGTTAPGRTFYLVRNGSDWTFTLTPQDLSRDGVERFTYWPAQRQIAFQFASPPPRDWRADYFVCRADRTQRSNARYGDCSTAFKTKLPMDTARVLYGVLSLGTSELSGVAAYRIDRESLLAAVNKVDIDVELAKVDQRTDFENATNRTKLMAYVNRNLGRDADGTVRLAQEKLAQLDRNRSVLKAAEQEAGSLDTYRSRVSPKNPSRYCDPLAGERPLFDRCRAEVSKVVADLANRKATELWRFDVCTNVHRRTTPPVNTSLCQAYRDNGSCSARSPGESAVCDILLKKGQS